MLLATHIRRAHLPYLLSVAGLALAAGTAPGALPMIGARFRGQGSVRLGYWFRSKRFGVGAVPVTWQGWAATFGFLAVLGVIVNFANHRDRLWLVLLLPVIGAYLWLIASKTDGEWRFRWGGDA